MSALGTALSLAAFAPGVARWLGGDKAGVMAEQVVNTARAITGVDNEQDAALAIKNNPQLQVAFQQAIQPVLIAQYEAESKQLESINATMRAEYAINRPFVSYWRPFFGYIVAITWLITMLAIGYVCIKNPAQAAAIISAMASLSFMWSVALAVLGISVRERSKDKQVAAGMSPGSGLLGAVADRLLKKPE